MDWTALDEAVSDKLERTGREFGLLMTNLIFDYKTVEPVGTWLLKHAPKMKEIGTRIAMLSPAAARVVLGNGGMINLAHDHQSWFVDYIAIGRVSQLDEESAKTIVQANVAYISKGIAELSLAEGMPELLRLISGEPELLEQVLSSVDIKLASERWPKSLTDHRSNERKIARTVLKFVRERNQTELGRLAGRLLREVRYRKPPPKVDDICL